MTIRRTPDKPIAEGVHRTNTQARRRARAARPDGGGSYTLTVPGGAGWVYVREEGAPLSLARDLVGLSSPTDDDAPVWIEQDKDQTWAVTQRRYEGS